MFDVPSVHLEDAVSVTGLTSPVRVALFTGAYNHIADGVSLTLNRLVHYLETQGHSVRVFAPTVREPELSHKGTLIPAWSVPAPGRPDYRLALGLSPKARHALSGFDPDLYHVATPDLLGHQALRLAQRSGKPVVASYHTHFSSYLGYYGLGQARAPAVVGLAPLLPPLRPGLRADGFDCRQACATTASPKGCVCGRAASTPRASTLLGALLLGGAPTESPTTRPC